MGVNMYLEDLPAGSIAFIDSNIFTYFVLAHSRYFSSVKSFLKRLDMGFYTGYINQTVVNETYFNFIKVKVDKGVVLQMAFDNSSSVGEAYGGAEIDKSGETGLVGYRRFNRYL